MNSNNTTFIITGGAGRVVCSMPALEKYHYLNPDDDFKVIVHGWESLFWSNPILQDRTIGVQKGTFEEVRQSRICIPEPYQNHSFINQKKHLIEAFDEEINQTNIHYDLNCSCLYLSELEIEAGKELIEKYKTEAKKKKVIIFQPYGSGTEIINKKPIDGSNRSLNQDHALSLIRELSKDAVVLNASNPMFKSRADTYSVTFDDKNVDYFRRLMGLIYHCDYFVGCCSAGQHIAHAFQKPGLILMGATHDKNFSYPNHFKIYRKKGRLPVYSPWRISEVDIEFANRSNNEIMTFQNDERQEILDMLNIGKGKDATAKEEFSYS